MNFQKKINSRQFQYKEGLNVFKVRFVFCVVYKVCSVYCTIRLPEESSVTEEDFHDIKSRLTQSKQFFKIIETLVWSNIKRVYMFLKPFFLSLSNTK